MPVSLWAGSPTIFFPVSRPEWALLADLVKSLIIQQLPVSCLLPLLPFPVAQTTEHPFPRTKHVEAQM